MMHIAGIKAVEKKEGIPISIYVGKICDQHDTTALQVTATKGDLIGSHSRFSLIFILCVRIVVIKMVIKCHSN